MAELLESSQFTDEFRQLLPDEQTALPNDLVVKPPVRKKSALNCNCPARSRVLVGLLLFQRGPSHEHVLQGVNPLMYTRQMYTETLQKTT